MRYAARVDDNQKAVVEAFRKAGASVLHLHAVGHGCPDLLVGVDGIDVQVEVKDGAKAPSARKLTGLEQRHVEGWRGRPVALVESPEAALDLVRLLRLEAQRGHTPVTMDTNWEPCRWNSTRRG